MNPRRHQRGFTLVEVLVGMTILIVLMTALMGLTSRVLEIWGRNVRSKDAFSEGRTALENMARLLAQTTLNPYWSYTRDPTTGAATGYGPTSELHFLCERTSTLMNGDTPLFPGSAIFAQIPHGESRTTSDLPLRNALNIIGYFVAHGPDPERDATTGVSLLRGTGQPSYRLYQWIVPIEDFPLYQLFSNRPPQTADPASFTRSWVDPAQFGNTRVIANHVLGLFVIARYKDADGTPRQAFLYDTRSPTFPPETRHQLPEALRIGLLVMDETSALALGHRTLTLPETLYDDPSTIESELEQLTRQLAHSTPSHPPIHTRVLWMDIPLTGERWSR